MNIDSLFVIEHPTGERIRLRQTEHEWAETDALHHTANSNIASASHSSIRRLESRHYTTAALPADLHHVAVLCQDGHGALTIRNGEHPGAGRGVGFNVVFDILEAFPFQPLTHLLRVGATFGSEKFEVRHG